MALGSMALVVLNLIPQPRMVEVTEGKMIPSSSPIRETIDGTIAPEGYRLEVNPTGSVMITSSDAAGRELCAVGVMGVARGCD